MDIEARASCYLEEDSIDTTVSEEKRPSMDDQGDVMKKRLKNEVVENIYMPYNIYVVPLQDRLLSCQLRPTFPPAWKEQGTVRL